MTSAPAWAVGERILLAKGDAFADQLKETLCISMECGTGVDAKVSAKVIKGNKVEIKVFSPTGALKATVTAPLNAQGKISAMDESVQSTMKELLVMTGRIEDDVRVSVMSLQFQDIASQLLRHSQNRLNAMDAILGGILGVARETREEGVRAGDCMTRLKLFREAIGEAQSLIDKTRHNPVQQVNMAAGDIDLF